jgi:hypothetical protein
MGFDVRWAPEADATMTRLEADPAEERTVDEIWTIVDALSSPLDDAMARRTTMFQTSDFGRVRTTAAGRTGWHVIRRIDTEARQVVVFRLIQFEL